MRATAPPAPWRDLHARAASPAGTRRGRPANTSVSTRVRTISSRKNGLPSGALDQELAASERGSAPSSASQQRLDAFVAERIQPESACSAAGRSTVSVLGAVADQQQHGRRGCSSRAVEQAVGLRVVPVQVLEHDEHRLDAGLADSRCVKARASGAGAAAAPEPARGSSGRPEEREHRRARRLQDWSSSDEPPVDLLAHRRASSSRSSLEVRLQQVDQRRVRRGRARRSTGRPRAPAQPRVVRRWMNSRSRRDFPTPGSPTTASIWPCPGGRAVAGPRRRAPSRGAADEGASGRARRPPGAASARGAAATSLVHLHRRGASP